MVWCSRINGLGTLEWGCLPVMPSHADRDAPLFGGGLLGLGLLAQQF